MDELLALLAGRGVDVSENPFEHGNLGGGEPHAIGGVHGLGHVVEELSYGVIDPLDGGGNLLRTGSGQTDNLA